MTTAAMRPADQRQRTPQVAAAPVHDQEAPGDRGDERPAGPDEQRRGDDPRRPAAIQRGGPGRDRRSTPGRPAVARRRSPSFAGRATRGRCTRGHRQPGEQEGDRLWSLGRPVHPTSTGSLGGREAPAVEAAVDELRRPEVLAPATVARPASLNPSPSTSQQPSRQPVDRAPSGWCGRPTSPRSSAPPRGRRGRLRARRARHDRPAARCPAGRLQLVRASPSSASPPARRHGLDRARRQAGRRRGHATCTGTGAPSMARRSSRQPVSRSAGRTVLRAGGQLADRRRQVTGSP